MKIYHISRIGQFHLNQNEDYYITEEISKNHHLLAVMDGCSSGNDSHFASNLIGKILRKIAKNTAYKIFASKSNPLTTVLLEDVVQELFSDLQSINLMLDLDYDELLSTLVMGIINKEDRTGEFLIAGDGLVVHNSTVIEFEQGNKPDYIGYHINKPFGAWFRNQTERLSLSNISDISLATDGIFTFRPYDNKIYPLVSKSEIADYFFNDSSNLDNPQMLIKHLRFIEKEYGLKPTDDLTIVRVVFYE